MINKELSEILDALTRETGESMLPYQELEILGLSPLGESSPIPSMPYTIRRDSDYDFTGSRVENDDIDYDEESDDNYDDYEEYDDGEDEEEYEFDEDDEKYDLLTQVLRLNNCRKKYFA
ncbi:MAG: hypothetical protein J6Q73_05570 [Bacteroidaceae bacterium]|nr:hypothetical protein [Bacteroidaceae bacterium]